MKPPTAAANGSPLRSARLDTTFTIETPEGVDLELHVAGLCPRALAWALDLALRGGIYLGLFSVLGIFGEFGSGAILLVLFVGEWFYPVLFEVLGGGATPGKRQQRLLVIHSDGSPIGWAASCIRNFLRFADFLPMLYAVGIVTLLFDRHSRRLGDLAAGTLVIHRDTEAAGGQLPKAEPSAPPVPLRPHEQRAIVAFGERLPTWTDQRVAELATIARPLTHQTGRASASTLLAYANWLVGRR